jgi:hypothetical protein
MSVLQIVHVESEWYWGQFFSSIQNTDYKEKFMGQLSEYLGRLSLVMTCWNRISSKGQSHEIFDLCFFHESIPLESLIYGLKYFYIWLRIREYVLTLRYAEVWHYLTNKQN